MATIKVGPYNYSIKAEVPESSEGFDKDMWGDVRHDLLRIRINKYSKPEVSMVTLMHEVLHCLGFMVGEQVPEEMIAAISPLLVMVLEENGISLNPWKKLLKEAGTQ